VNVREVHARALEDAALLDELRDAAPALRPRPLVAPECAAVGCGQAHDYRLLKLKKALLDRGGVQLVTSQTS